MLRENLTEFFKDLGYIFKKIFTSRMVIFGAVGAALFAILIIKLFNMQIVHGDDYTNSYIMKAEKTVTTTGTRGNIYDRNGKLLAYSELAYSVVIEDSGIYETTGIHYAELNAIIAKMVTIIETNGDSIDYDFGLNCDENGNYYYSISDNTLLRFLRDVYGHSAISELTDEERNASAAETAKTLRNRYRIYTAEDVEELKEKEAAAKEKKPEARLTDYDSLTVYDDVMAMKIAYIRYNLAANSYKRYVSFTVATNINSYTMAAILENEADLTGVSIEEDTVRKYNYGTYIAHIVGYTGKVSSEQLEELQAIDPSYEATDVVGRAGIEQQYETTLAGTKGETTMLVDNVGRVLEVTNEVEASAGKDIYLTIDIDLQQEIYDLLERRLAEIVVSYLTPSDSPFREDGQILLPIKDVYFALINNNLIDMEQIQTSQTEAATATYALFSQQKANVLEAISEDLSGGIPYASHTDDMKSYLRLIRTLLIDNGILNSDKISSTDELTQQWSDGSISLREYLEGAINNQWINIYNLDIDAEYTTTGEVLECVIDYAQTLIGDSRDFDKLIYEYLIDNNILSGREVCLILMEQGAVEYTESEYVNIYNGGSAFDFLEEKIANLDITPAQLALDPCSGSCVMEDPNTGEILAMVSYPSYDINYFSGSIDAEYYSGLLDDKSTPLVNRATQTRIAPGSTFKPLIAIAGLAEGVITDSENVYCDGVFDKITPNIKCWINPDRHGNVSTESALEHSCNEYFCEIGYRLCFTPSGEMSFEYGLEREKYYAELLGLATKTGIQLPETAPQASDYNAVASSIGQGTNAYTSLNLARYVSTLANSGTVYNSSIISRISNADGSNVEFIEPAVANTVDIDPSIWTTVHNGMKRVISEGVMDPLTSTLPAEIYGKSGTAQEDKTRGDHACYIMFSTDENGDAEVAVSVMIPYGHSATHAGVMAYYALASYYDYELPSSIIFTTSGTFEITE